MVIEKQKVLLTGATGLIGGEIYNQLPAKRNVYLLCRDLKKAESKLLERQNAIINNKNKFDFNIIEGNLCKKDWGLNSFDYDAIIHCAGETSFINRKKCIETNVNGIQNIIALIKASKSPLFIYIGTASSHGNLQNQTISEETIPNNEHFNCYTESKQEAEKLIKKHLDNYLILKPTIVLGDNVKNKSFASSIGWAFYITKYFSQLPFNGDSYMDFIPVSYLGNVVNQLLKKKQLKYTEYLISSNEQSVKVDKIINYLNTYFKRKKSLKINIYESNFKGEQRRLFNGLKYYIPFINMNLKYSDQRVREELPDLYQCPNLVEYLDFVLDQIEANDAKLEAVRP